MQTRTWLFRGRLGLVNFVLRHFARLDEETLVGEEAYPTPDQPEPAFVPAISKDTVKRGDESTRWKPASLDLRFGHHEHLMLFLDPRKFGLVESRQRVAGFQPHGYPGSNSRHLSLLGQKLLRIDLGGPPSSPHCLRFQSVTKHEKPGKASSPTADANG